MRVKTMSQAILLLGLIVAPCLAIAAEPTFKEGWFTTNDGVKLHYLEAGSGNPLVMVPGWSQSAMEFKYQLTGLSDKYHVYALDLRGRVVSIYSTFFIGAAPLGHLAAGWLAEHIGAPRTFTVCGLLCALAVMGYVRALPQLRAHLRPIYLKRGIIPPPPSD